MKPPPPPPPRSKTNINISIPKQKQTSRRGGIRLFWPSVGVVAGVGYMLYQYRDKERVVEQSLASAFIKEQAEIYNDASAKAVLAKRKSPKDKVKGEFRLDISKEGLVETLTFLLETKRVCASLLVNLVNKFVLCIDGRT